MSAFVSLLGGKLESCCADVATRKALDGKGAVALFFSAQWCAPCLDFSQKLAQWYKEGLKAKGLEVVFVSSDSNESMFRDQLDEMPWLALPWHERARSDALTKRFKAPGLPAVVVLAPDGRMITRHGRVSIGNDPKGDLFPWRPRPCRDVLAGSRLISKDGDVDLAALEGKVLGLYFGAKRSPPCRDFSAKLASWYPALKDKGFEIIFLSSDEDEDNFREYFGTHPWLALDFEVGRKAVEELALRYEIKETPSLIIIDKDGSTITKEGTEVVSKDPVGEQFPWYTKPVFDLAKGPGPLNEGAVFVALCEASSAVVQSVVEEAMEEPARKYWNEAKAVGSDMPKVAFALARNADALTFQLRTMMSLPQAPPPGHQHPVEQVDPGGDWVCDGCGLHCSADEKPFTCTQGCDFDHCWQCHEKAGRVETRPPSLALVDMDFDAYYPFLENEVTSEKVHAFVTDFEAGRLKATQIPAGRRPQ